MRIYLRLRRGSLDGLHWVLAVHRSGLIDMGRLRIFSFRGLRCWVRG